ncbi:DUF7096 domain-containing protein [Halobaculum sp. EA56]|uniref:DUF7096 domain-containing protein n=1 Tax=Halobaculum sp. EA56 TaxID=3421648 RepID=UPI003EBCA37D
MRAIPVALAALLVCAAVGVGVAAPPAAAPDRGTQVGVAAAGADDGGTGTAAFTPHNGSGALRVLSLNGSQRVTADVDVVTVDAGTATGLGANASAARIETIAMRERIESANTTDERQKRILDGLNEVDKDVITLHSRQRAALRGYADGELTARQLLVELAEIRATARTLEERVRLLNRLADETEEFSLDDSRVFSIIYDLQTFDGPVRERAAAALRGEPGASTRIYVATTRESVVLSTVAGDEYVREAFRGDLRDRDETGINEEVAQNVTERSYPEVYAATGGSVSGQGSGGTFLFDLRYPNGTLTAFVGGGSERVFLEWQRVDLAGIDTGEPVSRTLDLTLTVNRTFPGGPLRVAVTDPETGDPIDAIVKIGREGGESVEVGTTGDDGVLWTVSPRGSFVVTVVEVGSAEVSTVSVEPSDPHTVEEAFSNSTGSPSIDDGT